MAGNETFEAQINRFKEMTLQNIRYVVANATQDIMEAAQTPQLGITKGATGFVEGKIPVAESDLIQSLYSSINGGGGSKGELSYTTAIAGFNIGDTMFFTWESDHAAPMEYGFTTSKGTFVPGRHYVGANVKNWQAFVQKYAAEVFK